MLTIKKVQGTLPKRQKKQKHQLPPPPHKKTTEAILYAIIYSILHVESLIFILSTIFVAN